MKIMDMLPAFTAVIGGLTGWLFTRHKQAAETKQVEITNTEKLLCQYRKALDDLTERHEKKFKELEATYERKIKVLEDEIRVHKRLITAFKQEVATLKKQLKVSNQ